MRHGAGLRVERQARHRFGAVADGAQHERRRDGLGVVGGDGPYGAVVGAAQCGPYDGQAGHPVPALDPRRAGQEAQHDAAAAGDGGAGGEFGEDRRLGRGVRRQALGPSLHEDVDVVEGGERDQFGQGERGLGRSAPPEDDDLADPARAQRGQGPVGDVGTGEGVGVGGQDPGHVQGHVAVADDDGPFGVQRVGGAVVVGVAVVPGDEVGGGGAAGQVLALDAEAPVGGGAHGVDHGVVVADQVLMVQVVADPGVEAVREAGLALDGPEQFGDPLGVLVVGGHSGPRESVRGGQPVVHGDAHAGVPEQFVGGEESGRSGADHGHPQPGGLRPALRGHEGHGGAVGVRGGVVVGAVEFEERQLALGELGVRFEGVHRAGRRARPAVDAGAGVDVQHLGLSEARFAGGGVDAVDRAGQHTRRVGAARPGDDVGHGERFSVHVRGAAGTAPGRRSRPAGGCAARTAYARRTRSRCVRRRAGRARPGSGTGARRCAGRATPSGRPGSSGRCPRRASARRRRGRGASSRRRATSRRCP